MTIEQEIQELFKEESSREDEKLQSGFYKTLAEYNGCFDEDN